MKSIITKTFVGLVIVIVVFLVGLNWNLLKDKIQSDNQPVGEGKVLGNCRKIISDTSDTTQTLSQWTNISDSKSVGFIFTRDDDSAGNTLFKIYTSPNESSSVQYERLVANNDEDEDDSTLNNLTSSSTLDTASIAQYWMSQEDVTGYVMASIDITTDGKSAVWLCER